MIKIALVSHSPYLTGAEKMLFQLALILKGTQTYMPVIFIPAGNPPEAMMKACRENAIELAEYPAGDWYIWSDAQSLDRFSTQILESTAALEALYLQYGIDLVVANTMTQIAPALAARRLSLPVCLWVHGILDSYLIPQGDMTLRLLLDRYLMSLSDQIVCCSEWTASYYRPIAAKPVRIITNWAKAPAAVEPVSAKNAFVCLNTFDENKGVATLLEAADILARKGYRFSLRLYGAGGEESRLRACVQEKKLEDIVQFFERTNDVDAVYRSCMCLVQPSYIESFGLTMVEAMANGRPVISARNGGSEMIVQDGETGWLVRKKDAGELAQRMAEMMDTPGLAERMGMAGRRRYEALFSPEKAGREFIALFDAMAGEPAKPASRTDILLEDTWDWIFTHFRNDAYSAGRIPLSKRVKRKLRHILSGVKNRIFKAR